MKKYTAACALCFSVLSSIFGIQVLMAQEEATDIAQGVKVGEIVSCSEYYQYDSVSADLEVDSSVYEIGDPIIVSGTLTNTTDRPIIDATIRARLVKDIPMADAQRATTMVLDEFEISSNVFIEANGTSEVSYAYPMALNAPSGDYKLYVYVVEAGSFDLAGVYYDDGVTAATLEFQVAGEQADYAYLDQTQITVGELPYDTADAYFSTPIEGSLPVTIPLYNSAEEERVMRITYDLYSYSSLNPTQKLDTRTEQVTVPAQSEVQLSYAIDKGAASVYYLSISAEPADQSDPAIHSERSRANIRVADENAGGARLTYVGVTDYPAFRGKESAIVTCFQNANPATSTSAVKVQTFLYDENKNEIARIEYDGQTTSDIIGLIQKFKPQADLTSFTIASTIVDAQGNTIDSVERTYSCDEISPDLCQAKAKPISAIVIVSLAAIIIGLAAILYNRKDLKNLRV